MLKIKEIGGRAVIVDDGCGCGYSEQECEGDCEG